MSNINCRVQIPAYTDAWMMGDRYGRITRQRGDIVTVRMDKSNKLRKFVITDCEVIEVPRPLSDVLGKF